MSACLFAYRWYYGFGSFPSVELGVAQ